MKIDVRVHQHVYNDCMLASCVIMHGEEMLCLLSKRMISPQ